MKNRIQDRLNKEIVPELMKSLGLNNPHAVPTLKKIVVNSGIGEMVKNKEQIESFRKDLANLAGQTPSVQKARISVASFGIRRGMPVGLKVTLRGAKMYHFLDKLVSVVLPRLRDFRGIPANNFDKNGNYSLGFPEQTVFPEIDVAKTSKIHGLEVVFVTNSGAKESSRKLLELLGLPFEK